MAGAVVGRGRGAVVIGRDAPLIVEALAAAKRDLGKPAYPVERAPSLEEAVRCARAMALPGDVVILSPACTSFDMFSSYEERGDRFRAAVRAFAAPVTP